MSSVFRLYKSGSDTIVDWGQSNPYGSQAIDQIQDPNGASAKKEITSIPSPFARMDLIKTAYAEVVKSNNLHGTTIYHKMVSDALDIAQIFFNYNKLRDRVKIIVWDVDRDLQALKNNSKHKMIGDTLEMFMQQDAATYNFNEMKYIYLLQYTGAKRKTQMDIIGATSPATLFFSSANDLSYLSNEIQFEQDKVFDSHYASLDQREVVFIEYMYAYRKAYTQFNADFPEIDKYLDLVYRALSVEMKNRIDDITAVSIDDYPELTIQPNYVEINGMRWRCRKENTRIQSGFEIASDICTASKKPLVLPVEEGSMYADIPYVSAPWGCTNKAPYFDGNALEERTLPCDGEKYPYLTISDFLEDTLVQVMNDGFSFSHMEFFYPVNQSGTEVSYLLPLKNKFFEYFSPKDLFDGGANSKKMLEFEKLSGASIKVTLRIPIKGSRNVEYERIYTNGLQADKNRNKGCLMIQDFAMGVFPAIKFKESKDAFYRLLLIRNSEQCNDLDLTCYNSGVSLNISSPVVRNDRSTTKCKTYVVENQQLDYCRINCGQGVSGIILPHFLEKKGTDAFTFAIDFGTTNTHVEYSQNGKPTTPLNIEENNTLMKLWGNVISDFRGMLNYDFLPEVIGEKSEFYFPMRTALNEAKNTNWNQAVYAYANANIPFPFEKKVEYDYNRVITDLKWSNDIDNIKKVRCYIESIMWLLRCKVLSCYGDLHQTKIVWFYPISMTPARFNNFNQEWKNAYEKYFGGNPSNIVPVTESVAPYEYYKGSVNNANNMVTVDIGGGTSDVVIASNGVVDYISSFRFAANSIFGDAYAQQGGGSINSLLTCYKPIIKKVLDDNNLAELSKIFKTHFDDRISSNIASFFFSLKGNKEVMGKGVSDHLDFNKMLQNDNDFKIVFLLFYSALIYHVAKMMKAKGKEMPRHICFSGNGSKVIKILSTSNETLEDYTKLLFEKVYGQAYSFNGLTILQNERNPKEVTCKGGISNMNPQSYNQIAKTKIVLKSSEDTSNPFITEEVYGDIDDTYIKNSLKSVKEFLDMIFSLSKEFSFKNYFDISDLSLQVAKTECYRDLSIYLQNGLALKRMEVSENDPIEETLFFYPMNGMLNALIAAIYNKKN